MKSLPLVLGFLEKPFQICKADSGAIRFRVTIYRASPCLILRNKACPHEPLYQITLSQNSTLCDLRKSGEEITFTIPNFYAHNTYDFWLTWFNDVICIGKANEPALLQYSEPNKNEDKLLIGFLQFSTRYENFGVVEWSFESTPNIYKSLAVPKKVNNGKLRWIKMRTGDVLPIDAMVAGFEKEHLYIARARHRGSLCPGKYVRSKQLAFIPWGSAEHSKNEFEVLCGYDAKWVKCYGNRIPENAFIGGKSEVRSEPLFIGRATVQKNVIPGKVHLLYKTCYLPYNGREVEKYVYEILVTTHVESHSEPCDILCHTNMVMKPCL